MAEQKLTFALSDPDDSRPGGLVPEILIALDGIQDAVRLMVQHLGDCEKGLGQSLNWIRDLSTLHLVEMRPGFFVADLVFESPRNGQSYSDDFGNRALEALQEWDGMHASTLPKDVEDKLHSTAAKLSEGVRLWLGAKENPRRVEIQSKSVAARATTGVTEALLHGWLYEVNWDKRTAQLHDFSGEYVQLRFSDDFHQEMLRLATRHVELKGKGRLDSHGKWTTVEVQQLNAARSWNDPFDVEAFLNDPDPKSFNSERVVTTSEPFDVDDFISDIRNGREVLRGRPG